MDIQSSKKYIRLSHEALDNGALLEIPCVGILKDMILLSNKNQLKLLQKPLSEEDTTLLDKYNRKVITDETDFEVECILDYITIKGVAFYYVKWKNWSHKYNTWEPVKNLYNCLAIRESFTKLKESKLCLSLNLNQQHFDKVLKLQELGKPIYKHNIFEINLSKQHFTCKDLKHLLSLPDHYPLKIKSFFEHAKLQKALKEWEFQINSIIGCEQVQVSNEVDDCHPPNYFTFINDYIPGKNVIIPNEPVIGCDCPNNCQTCFIEEMEPMGCSNKKLKVENENVLKRRIKKCCSVMSGSRLPYNKRGRVRLTSGVPIYECNKLCKCDTNLCQYRVVQKGNLSLKFSIFRTEDGRGWGVRTQQRIWKNTFVMEYIGEIITNEEAEMRGQIYDSNGITYLFDLDFCDQDNAFTIDAGHFGNISHFVNHSCDPNLVVYAVYINNLDIRLPRIALFARCDIQKGEELTFDYLNFANNNFQAEKRNATVMHLNKSYVSGCHTYEMPIKEKLLHYVDFHQQLDLLTPPSSSISSKDSYKETNSETSDSKVVNKFEDVDAELMQTDNLKPYRPYSTPRKVFSTLKNTKSDLPLLASAGLDTPPYDDIGNGVIGYPLEIKADPEEVCSSSNVESDCYDQALNHDLLSNASTMHDTAMEANAQKLIMNASMQETRDVSLKITDTARIPCKCNAPNCRKFIF